MTSALSYFVFGFLLCVFAGAAIFEWRSSRKRAQRDWHELVAEIQPVDFSGVTAVAIDYLTPRRGQIAMEPENIWGHLGGYEGLKKMRKNAEIMLALAAYAQQWNFDEAVIVTERMRHDAVLLSRAVRRVRLGMIQFRLMRGFRLTLPLRVQEAAASYYLMRQRLLALYETSHACRYPALAASL